MRLFSQGTSGGGLGLNLLGGLAAGAVAVLLLPGDVADVSAAAGALSVSSLGLGAPVISSLLGVDTASGLGVSSLLLVEIGSSGEPGNHMGVRVLLTSRRSTSSLFYCVTISPTYHD